MKPFIFRLQALRMLRDFEKEAAFEAYGVSVRERQQAEDFVMAVSEELKNLQDQINERRKEAFPAFMQPHYMNAIKDAEIRLAQGMENVAKAEEKEQKALNTFLEAKANVDILDKLKEKRRDAHIAAETLKEEKEIEDLVNARHSLLV